MVKNGKFHTLVVSPEVWLGCLKVAVMFEDAAKNMGKHSDFFKVGDAINVAVTVLSLE